MPQWLIDALVQFMVAQNAHADRVETALYGNFKYTDANGNELQWRNIIQLLMEAAGRGDGMDYEAIKERLDSLTLVDSKRIVNELIETLKKGQSGS